MEVRQEQGEGTRQATRLYRHKTIMRYKIGPFEFRDHELRLPLPQLRKSLDEQVAMFEKLLDQLPIRESISIVEINEEAQAQLERPARRAVAIHGAQQSTDVNKPRAIQPQSPAPSASILPGVGSQKPVGQ